jgi:hypothetical protein
METKNKLKLPLPRASLLNTTHFRVGLFKFHSEMRKKSFTQNSTFSPTNKIIKHYKKQTKKTPIAIPD